MRGTAHNGMLKQDERYAEIQPGKYVPADQRGSDMADAVEGLDHRHHARSFHGPGQAAERQMG